MRLKKLFLASFLLLGAPMSSYAEGVVVARLCDSGKIGIKEASDLPSEELPELSQEESKSGEESSCVKDGFDAKSTYDEDFFAKKIRAQLNEADARVGRASKLILPEYFETLAQMAGDKPGKDGKYQLKSFASILDANRIDFLLELSAKVYKESGTGFIKNNKSKEYDARLIKYKNELEKSKVKVKRLDEFLSQVESKLGSDQFVQLEELYNFSSIQGAEGEQAVKYTQKNKNGQGAKEKFSTKGNNLNTNSISKKGIKVKNLTPQTRKELIKGFNGLSKGAKISGDVTEEELIDAIFDLKAKVQIEEAYNEDKLADFKDENMRDAWIKLKKILGEEAQGFEPILIFYRNTKNYNKISSLLKKVAKSKYNPEIDGKRNSKDDYYKNKQFSGVMFFKSNVADNGVIEDEVIFTFSGSNSQEDWKHNLDVFKKSSGATAENRLGYGVRVHQGIFNSLNESLSEAGTKLHLWISDYKRLVQENPGQKRTLKFTTTGHSLGGALGLLMGLYLKKTIVPSLEREKNLSVSVDVVTFGAPPIFEPASANRVEEILGKDNITRVWAQGDPVVHLGILHRDDKRFSRSILGYLLDYKHVGKSIPLFDKLNLRDLSQKLNIPKNHSIHTYTELVDQFKDGWLKNSDSIMNQIKRQLDDSKVGNLQMLAVQLKQAQSFIQDESQSQVRLDTTLATMEAVLKKSSEPVTEKTLQNIQALQSELDQKRDNSKLVLSKKQKNDTGIGSKLTYEHKLKGVNDLEPFSITRSTSCQPKSFLKKVKGLSQSEKDELACGCCWSKQLFLSNDGSLIAKIRGAKKDISSLEKIESHCKPYCSTAQERLFPSKGKSLFDSVSRFLGKMTMVKKDGSTITLKEQLSKLNVETKKAKKQ